LEKWLQKQGICIKRHRRNKWEIDFNGMSGSLWQYFEMKYQKRITLEDKKLRKVKDGIIISEKKSDSDCSCSSNLPLLILRVTRKII
jgi:hypothetical protein